MSPAVTLVTYKLCSYCEVFLDVQERAADVPAKIRECGTPRQRIHLAPGIDADGVLEQVALHLSHMTGDEFLPVLLSDVPHLPRAL